MDKYTVADIISASLGDKPLDVNNFFNDLMADKTKEYVDNKREEISNRIFNSDDYEDDEVEIDVEEVEDGEQLELDLDQDDYEDDSEEEYEEDEEKDLENEELEDDGEDA